MFSPSQPEKKSKRKTVGSDDSLYKRPDVALFNEKQWLYVQRRYRMSPRELQVAKLVCQGFTNGDMADKLRVRPGTVKTHLRNVFGKTRARNKITLLLRFMDDINKFFGESASTAPIPITEGEKPTKKTANPGEIFRRDNSTLRR